MSHYSRLIADTLGVSPELAEVAEQMLRDNRSGLDHLSARELTRLAKAEIADLMAWHAHGPLDGITATMYCEIAGLPVPPEFALAAHTAQAQGRIMAASR